MNVQAQSPVVGKIVVDNPAEFAERVINPKINADRNLRDDPLGQMHDRKQIGEAQYHAGRTFQSEWERAGHRMKSSGDLQEPVDGGGRLPQGITDAQLRARDKIEAHRRLLGRDQFRLAELILIDKLTLWAATARLYPDDIGAGRRKFIGTWFREILTILARAMQLAS